MILNEFLECSIRKESGKLNMNLDKVEMQGMINKNINGSGISFLASCIVEDELYFSSWHTNGFYKMNLKTGICIFLGIFEKETKSRYLHNQAIFFEGAIWFIPTHGGMYIVRINIDTLEQIYIKLPENGKTIKNNKNEIFWQFKCCYEEGNSEFWLVPLGYNMLLKIDMLTNEISEYKDIRNELVYEDGKINFSDACLVDNEIWICPYYSDKLVIFNIITKEYKFILWRDFKNDFAMIRNYKNWMIFIPRIQTKSILLFNKDTFEEKEIFLNVSMKNEKVMYLIADMVNQFLILAPFFAKEFVVVDMETENVQVDINLNRYRKQLGWGNERYQSSFFYEGKIIYASEVDGNPLMIYDTQTDIISYKEVKVDRKIFIKTIHKLLQKNEEMILRWLSSKENIILENEVPLSLFCLYPKETKEKNGLYDKNSKKTVGEIIFLDNK